MGKKYFSALSLQGAAVLVHCVAVNSRKGLDHGILDSSAAHCGLLQFLSLVHTGGHKTAAFGCLHHFQTGPEMESNMAVHLSFFSSPLKYVSFL